MTDCDALYRAILEHPEDDTLRLVFADALEEDGEPRRAAFIRAHVELSRLPDYDPRAVQLRHHDRSAWPDPHWTLALELPDGIDWAGAPFRRGLPGAIEAENGASFVKHADELFMRFPIESLELRVLRLSEARPLAECSWLERVASLSFSQGAGAQAVGPLLASEHLTRLTELRLGSEFTTPSAVSAVVRSKVFKRLTSLAVRSDSRAGGTMAGELARLAKPPALRKLDLSGNRLDADAIARLVRSEAVAAVEELDLGENTLRTEGVAALAEGELPGLRSLHLLRTRPDEGGVSSLPGAAFFPRLRGLSLGGNNLAPSAAFALAGAPVDNLRVLDLRENRIGDRGAISLAENARLANLVLLDLAEAKIGNEGAEAIADSPHLRGLIYLNLFDNNISPRVAELLRSRFGDRVFL